MDIQSFSQTYNYASSFSITSSSVATQDKEEQVRTIDIKREETSRPKEMSSDLGKITDVVA